MPSELLSPGPDGGSMFSQAKLPFKTAFKHFFLMLTYFERDRKHVSRGGAERERKRERIPSRLHTVSAEFHMGLYPTNHEIMHDLSQNRVRCISN